MSFPGDASSQTIQPYSDLPTPAMPPEFGAPIPLVHFEPTDAPPARSLPAMVPITRPRRSHVGRWVAALLVLNLVAAGVYRTFIRDEASPASATGVVPVTVSPLVPKRQPAAVTDEGTDTDVTLSPAVKTLDPELAPPPEPAVASESWPIPATPGIVPNSATPIGDGQAYAVANGRFTVTLPGEPQADSFVRNVLGVDLTANVWGLRDVAGDFLQVMSMDLVGDFSAESFHVAFESMVQDMLTETEGRVVYDDDVAVAGGVGRFFAIDFPGGRIFSHTVAFGATVVAITAISPSLEPPQAFREIVASFAFS